MNQFEAGEGMEQPVENSRTMRVSLFLLLYCLGLLVISLIPLATPDSMVAMILAIGPVLYASFNYERRVYRFMILLALLLSLIDAHQTARDLLGTVALITMVTIPVILVAEMAHALLEGRRRVEAELKKSEERYRTFVTRFQGIAYQGSLDSVPFFLHGYIEEITGYKAEEFTSERIRLVDLILPEDRDGFINAIQRLRLGLDTSAEVDYRIRRADGLVRWLHDMSQIVLDSTGRPQYFQGVLIDITTSKQMEMALKQSQAHFRSLFENSPIPLWDEDFSRIKQLVDELKAQGVRDFRAYFHDRPEQAIRFIRAVIVNEVNHAALALVGVKTREELFGRMENVLGRGPMEGFIEQVCAVVDGKTYIQWEGPNDIMNGELRYHRITWSVSPGSEQTYNRVIVAIDDITESKRAEEALLYISSHDFMTGLYNRAFFDAELMRLRGSRLFPIAIFFADMDGLKTLNDTYGHAVGDELLRRAAEVLRASFRTEDVVARIGGDEFGVLLPESGPEAAVEALQRIQHVLEEHNRGQAGPDLGFSIGVAVAQKGDNLTEVLKKADENMYRNKAERRGA